MHRQSEQIFPPIADTPESWSRVWDAAEAAYPGPDLPCLTEAFLDEALALMAADAEIMEVLKQAQAAIRRSPDLCRLVWHWQYRMYVAPDVRDYSRWPLPLPLLPVFALLSGLPDLLTQQQQLGIPQEVTRETLSDIAIWMRTYRRRTGEWGLTEIGWLLHHFRGRLYRLGRLQFEFVHCPTGIRLLRHRTTRAVQLVSGAGIRYRDDGFVELNDDAAGGWVAQLDTTEDALTGHAITADGRAARQCSTFSWKEWHEEIAPGDPLLNVHIPEVGKMDYDQCGASFWQALDFFPRHFPEFQFVGFICDSWLLDPALPRLLPSSSNIVRVQREYRLFPIKANDGQTFERVFGGRPANLATAPRDTALRRAILDYLHAGGELRAGGGLIPREGFAWGARG